MKMRTRSMMDSAKGWLWAVAIFIVIWQLGFLKIALIGGVSYLLLLWVVGTFFVSPTPEQDVKIDPRFLPGSWKGVHDEVSDIFMVNGNEEDDVVGARFLCHINAIDEEQQPSRRETIEAIHCKMLYEYQRKYGSLEYNNKRGVLIITAPETLRALSNEERAGFMALCHHRFDDDNDRFSRARDESNRQASS